MLKRILTFLDRFHWLWLALAAPFLLFSSPSLSPVMIIIPALFLLRWLVLKIKQSANVSGPKGTYHPRISIMPSTPLNGALLLLMVMVLVSLWTTFDINYSLPKIAGVILGVGILYSFAREGETPRGFWSGYLVFMVLGIGIAALGLLGTNWVTKVAFLNPIISRLSPRITGLPGAEEGFNQNSMAGALLWVIPSGLAFSWFVILKAKDFRPIIGRGKAAVIDVLTIGATLLMIAILILAQSREGYIGLALTIIVLALIALSPKGRLYSLAGMLIIAIILGILLASHWNAVQSWALGSDLPAGSALSLDTLQVRMEIWSRAIYGIQDFPFTGMGMNVFRKAVSVLYPLFTIPPGRDIGHAHNEFLQAALDLGIPGLIAFIGLYIVAFWMLLSTWQRVRADERSLSPSFPIADASAKSVGRFSLLDASPFANTDFVKIELLGLGGGLLAHMIWGMTDTIALGARPGFLFWIILGLICGLHQQAQERAETIESIASSKSMDVGLHV